MELGSGFVIEIFDKDSVLHEDSMNKNLDLTVINGLLNNEKRVNMIFIDCESDQGLWVINTFRKL